MMQADITKTVSAMQFFLWVLLKFITNFSVTVS